MTLSSEERRVPTRGRAAPLLAATAVSVTGDGAFVVAAPLLAATLTSDPLTLSVVSASAALPWLIFGLPAGALTDRWPRRRTMIVADLARAAVLAAFAVLVLAGHATIVTLVLTVILIGAGQCFFDSASQGMIPALVGRDKDGLTRFNGWYWGLDITGRQLAGPTLGSAVFAASRVLPFAVDAVSFAVSAALVARLPETTPPATRVGVAASIREGVQFVARNRTLRSLALIACVNNSAYSIAMASFVLYAGQVLHVPAAGYGWLFAATAVGGVGAGWFAKPLTRRLSYRTTLAVGCLIQASTWFGVAATGNAWLSGVLFALLGAATTIATVALVSARQEATPDELLGRAVSVFRLLGVGVATVSALLGGVTATAFGLAAPLYVAALILAALGLGIASRPAVLTPPAHTPTE